MSFKLVLEKYRKISFSERDKGDRFERLMQAYLRTDPKYAPQFKNVWLWNEFPSRSDLGGSDTGIDLVALTHDGDYWAIQCKCYQEDATIDKATVDSFLSTSSRTFRNDQGQTTGFAQRLWISTTNKWSSNATGAIQNQEPPVTRINLHDLIAAPVDWEQLENGVHGEGAQTKKHDLFPHQRQVVENVHTYFKDHDRGKLIMACGTGKTFTSLRVAEHETNGNGLVLFLVPSIALLGQTLREWSAHSEKPINAIAICSDPEVTKQKSKNLDIDSLSVVDLAFPASTNSDYILRQFEQIKKRGHNGMTVVFSTYQSIEVVARAQKIWMKKGFPQFDLIICDEAHRTTGVSLVGEDESAFVRVHDADFIKAEKRLYMTATPRLYSDDAKSKAAQAEAILCSMDDPTIYGEEIHRLGFGEAVEKGLLCDYKVLVLTLSEADIPPAVQHMIASDQLEIKSDDASKIIGTINALSKQFFGDAGITKAADPNPMKRAVAFCANIATSKKIAGSYNKANEVYLEHLPADKRGEMVTIEAQHMDGTMSAPDRDKMLSWLKEDTPDNECRVITNVRVLSEGVDVPSLDSVLFLSARNSPIDVVQSVGRVMRRADKQGKKYGYIVIPVVIPADVEPEVALDDNERYRVVWTVLNALRAHDDRFNATVNKIDLNHKKPDNILIGRPEYSFDEDGKAWQVSEDSTTSEANRQIGRQLALQFEQLQSVVFARMVKKVGDRLYWEQWAKDVAQLAERQMERIRFLIENRKDQREAFDDFLVGLQDSINPSITEDQAVEMLAQHIITKPIFEALFEGYSFEKSNVVSVAMQKMLNELEGDSLTEESESLQKFYESVRSRAADIDNAEGKQRIIIELYDKFFATAFPKMVEQLGIVYTPVEVVDFIIHSVEAVLKKEFDRSVSDENVHVLDPFVGTGTFMTRLLQSGLIDQKDLRRKYKHELHANEIVLLAYYIAAVNIENVFHDLTGEHSAYQPFDGIVLTDTFQLGESDDELISETFRQNSERVERQKKAPLMVIMGNPPYSIGQKSANDNAQNQKYEKLDARISQTYAAQSSASLSRSLYDAYIKAFRWSTDRLDPENGGVIAFVSNGAWLDGNSTDGFRKAIEDEFSSIWVFNLRGNARTQGELRRKEAGNVFGHGSRTPIAITLLVKNPKPKNKKAKIHYYDIGDYLSREEKLDIIKNFGCIDNPKMKWNKIKPNEHGDWINQRSGVFETLIPMVPDKKFQASSQSFFTTSSVGTVSARDSWVYNFSKSRLIENIKKTIDHYNEERSLLSTGVISEPRRDSALGNWTRDWLAQIKRNTVISEKEKEYRQALYRPFTKIHTYFDDDLNQERYRLPAFFPNTTSENVLIALSSAGSNRGLSVLSSDSIADFHSVGDTHCFPLYYYDELPGNFFGGLFDEPGDGEYVRRDGVSNFILDRARKQYGKNVTKEDIFYYVYGVLHSRDYRKTFAHDLKRMLPRIPLVEDVRHFWHFSKAGRKLAELHINYEEVPAYAGVKVEGADKRHYKVEKMRFKRVREKVDGKTRTVNDRSTIHYNSSITISSIPEKAYDYVINGKSAIDWIMDRYQIRTDKKSGITNDPNDWAEEVGNSRYILDLLLSVINVSVQTVDIFENLPKLEFE